ncbi:11816_t:CDS:2, partial [Diversispora eburnea]
MGVAVKCLRKNLFVHLVNFKFPLKNKKKENAEIVYEDRIMIQIEGIKNLVLLLNIVKISRKVFYVMPLANNNLSDLIYNRRMPEQCCAKLGNFGLSEKFNYHLAPKVLGQFLKMNKSAWINYKNTDIWLLGTTLYAYLTGQSLLNNRNYPKDRLQLYSSDAIDLINKLMKTDSLKYVKASSENICDSQDILNSKNETSKDILASYLRPENKYKSKDILENYL